MEQIFSYIISFGASVMMPILFTIIGVCIGMKFGKSLKSGLYVGVGFVGLGIVTALLTNNFGSPLDSFSRIFNLDLSVFDMGWPAAASVAYNTAVGALIIPVCLGINFLLLITKCTRTVNIDLWNYWHFAFIGAVAYFVMDHSMAWGYFAAITDFKSYYDANMNLLDIDTAKTLFEPVWPIYTHTTDSCPVQYFEGSSIRNSVVANGSHIKGTVENSVIGRGVTIGKGAVVKNCIILGHSIIGDGIYLENQVVDKWAQIRNVDKLIAPADKPGYIRRDDII